MSTSLSKNLPTNFSAKPFTPPTQAENPYLSSGNFAPVVRETTAIDLRVRGRIPDELAGRRLCIGPSPIGARDPAFYHWFRGGEERRGGEGGSRMGWFVGSVFRGGGDM